MTSSFKVIEKSQGRKGLVLTNVAPDPIAAASSVVSLYEEYKRARNVREDIWAECWAQYLGTPQATEYLENNVDKIVGDVNGTWRHKINTGKAFEIVETVVGYLMSAMFPNSDWFSFVPREAGIQDIARAATKFIGRRLREGSFRSHMEMYVRQSVITGMSAMAMPYRTEEDIERTRIPTEDEYLDPLAGQMQSYTQYKDILREKHRVGMDFQTISVFDIWVEPHKDLNNGNVIRRHRMSSGDVAELMAEGYYDLLDATDIQRAWGKQSTAREDNNADIVESFLGVNFFSRKEADVIEFWGDISIGDTIYKDVVVTVVEGKAARIEPNPYWGGRPFVIGTCIPIPTQAFGLGVLEPVLGSVHELNIITNQRLDNLEMTLDNMWEVVQDNVLDQESLYARPGGMIPVSERGSITPLLNNNNQNAYVSYQEAGFMETRIDKTTGAGAYIGPGQGRKGERVTAQEIQAVRDAGGNRLSSIHTHIADTQLMPMVSKAYLFAKQFETSNTTVRLPMQGGIAYADFGPNELVYDYDVELMGAEFVAREEYELEKVISYIQLVSGNQEFAQRVNWDELLYAVTNRFKFKNLDWELFINKPEQPGMGQLGPDQAAMMGGAAPGQDPLQAQQDAIAQDMYASGGNPMVNALNASIQTRGPEATLNTALGQ